MVHSTCAVTGLDQGVTKGNARVQSSQTGWSKETNGDIMYTALLMQEHEGERGVQGWHGTPM